MALYVACLAARAQMAGSVPAVLLDVAWICVLGFLEFLGDATCQLYPNLETILKSLQRL